jgi:predicted transcriptional regulator
MDAQDKRVMLWLVICGLAIGCMVGLADSTEGVVEKPSEPGQYPVGRMNTTFWFGGKSTPARVVYYYPATSPGFNATPDTNGAPYPTILWYYYRGDPLNQTYEKEIYELITSYGFVFAVNYIENHPASPHLITQWTACVDAWKSYVDRLEELDGDPSSPLYGMMDKGRYGVLGHGGGIAGQGLANYDGRCNMAGFLSGRLSEEVKERCMVDFPCHFQRAEFEYSLESFTVYGYQWALGEKGQVLVEGADNYEGGYDLGMLVAFCLYYLYDYQDYRTFLYGEEVINGWANGEYSTLEFFVSDDEFFPPIVSVEELSSPIYMERNVSLKLVFTGYPELRNITTLHVNWTVNHTNGTIPFPFWMVTHKFPAPGDYQVDAQWTIGVNYGWAEPYYLTVVNMPPVAEPIPSRVVVNMDEEVVFDGNASWDTESHDDYLEFKWSFSDGEETEFSNVSTYKRTLTEPGPLEATLTVRDLLGAEDISNCTIFVVNVVPSVTAEGATSALEDQVLSFTGEAVDTPSDAVDLIFIWEFGDGTEIMEADSPDTTHVYETSETYKVTLRVRDPWGAEGNATFNITVTNVVPDGGIHELGDDDKFVDQQLEFMCWYKDTPSDNLTLVITWDFGDGNTSEGPYVWHTYEEVNEYIITLTLEDDDNATKVATTAVVIFALVSEDRPGPALNVPIVFSISLILVVILVLTAFATTEPGKYSIGLLGSPLFTRTKDVLDNKTRHALLGMIVTDPGIHYSAIREEFGLSNGAAAYHLNVMEREGFIRSARDGKLKRFYSAHTKVPEEVGMSPEDTREAIVELIRKRPGINQLQVMEALGMDRASASYYLRELVKEGRLKAGKKGWYTVYLINGRT